MSGVEVVGFLLGAIPLVISAVEHYRDCLDPLVDYSHYQSTLKALRTRLRIQLNLYEGTLKRLLLSELSLIEIELLFPSDDVPLKTALWGTEEIELKLRKKLGYQYETFMDVVWEMEGVMKKLMDKLDIDMEGKPKWTTASDTATGNKQSQRPSRLEWEWRKIRRSFGRKEREALMQNFERYNSNIAAVVQNNEILAPSTEPRAKSFVASFDLFRNHTLGLYEALEHSWLCGSAHSANLRLDGANPSVIGQKEPSFHVSFSYCQDGDCSSCESAESWKETVVTIDSLKDSQALAVSTCKTPNANHSPSDEKQQNAKSIRRKHKILRFLDRKDESVATVVESMAISQPIPNTSTTVMNSTFMITCLCQAIRNAPKSPKCLGVLSSTAHAEFSRLKVTTMTSSTPVTHLSLDRIIVSKENQERHSVKFGKLSRQQRLGLAVTLASMVLQFYNSPWLDEMWGKRDICFLFNGIDTENRPSISEPYISRTFSNNSNTSETVQSPKALANQFLSRMIFNKTLFALGIVLIELCLNKPFEDLRAAFDPSLGDQTTAAGDYQVAINSIDAVYLKGGTEYGYVVQRCLRCEFGVQDSKKRLDLDSFRSLVYEGVIAPLKEDFKKYSLYRGNSDISNVN